MRLISCHIENFGKLQNVDFEFNKDCTIFCEDNGWGKSTLASFVKVMFFGFDNAKAKIEAKNDKKKYKPWQGGTYGGKIRFEAEGKEYELTRCFGAKEKDDVFEVRDLVTNKVVTNFSENIGEELFKIDSASFARTVYISQNDCETSSTSSISAKIGNLADNTDDINNYDVVDKKLSDILNNMSLSRKTGLLYKKKETISNLTQEIKKAPVIDEAISELIIKRDNAKDEYEKLKLEQESLILEKKKVLAYKDAKAIKDKYIELTDVYEERLKKVNEEKSYFKGELPNEPKLDKLLADSSKLVSGKTSTEIYQLSEEEQEQFEKAKVLFRNGLPNKNEILKSRLDIKELTERRLRLAKDQMSDVEENKLLSYASRFANGAPIERTIDSKISNWNIRTSKQSALEAKQISLETYRSVALENIKRENENAKKTKTQVLYMLIAGIVAAIAGIGVCFANVAIGIILLLMGLGTAGAGVFLNMKKVDLSDRVDSAGRELTPKEIVEADTNIINIKREITEHKDFIERTERDIKQFMEKYDIIYDEYAVPNLLYDLKADIKEYDNLLQKKKTIYSKDDKKQSDLLENDVKKFLGRFYDESVLDFENYASLMHDLEMSANLIYSLDERVNNYNKSKELYESVYSEIQEFITKLKFSLSENPINQLQEIKTHLLTVNNSVEEYETIKKMKLDFEKKYKDALSNMPTQEMDAEVLDTDYDAQINSLTNRIEEIHKSLFAYKQQISKLEQDRDDISEKEVLLERLSEEFEKDKKKKDLLEKTKEMLEEAKLCFNSKYMNPIMSAFSKYYSIIAKNNARGIRIDADIRITVDEQGMQRNISSMSAGYKDLMGVCMRMALVDAMYKNEKPFLIFDDPFVNLDEEKVNGAMEFIKEISKEYQIIYFTCHNSRAI